MMTATTIFRRLLCASSFATIFLPALLLAQIENPLAESGPLSLEEAAATALRDNPGLAEIQARAQAIAAIPSQAGTLPDPEFRFNALNLPVNTFDVGQEPMTQLQLGISQKIPFPGKLALREETAKHEADAATSNVDEMRLQLVRDVKTLWWQLYFLDQSLVTVSRNQDLVKQFVEIAQVKYKVGQGLQQDVLLARLELSKLFDLEVQLRGARRSESARLNTLMDLPPDHAVNLPPEVNEQLPEPSSAEALYAISDESRPLLAGQTFHIQAAQTRLDLAKKDYYPDFNVGAYYGFRSGDNIDGSSRADFLSLGVGVNLPLFAGRKQAKAVDQRTSQLLEQQYALQDERGRVRMQISTALADYQQAREQFVLFKTGVIPQARQTVASMLAGYQVNKVDFLNLVQSQVTLYNYETQYWRALSEANKALANLSAAVGKETIHE